MRSVFSALLLVAVRSALAHPNRLPFAQVQPHTTHHLRAVVDGKPISSYHPPSTYETYGEGVEYTLRRSRKRAEGGSTEDITTEFLEEKLGISSDAFTFHRGYDNDVSGHAFFRQRFNGIPVANAVASVVINKDDKVSAFSSSFVKPKIIGSRRPRLTSQEAILLAEKALGGKYNFVTTGLEYFIKDDGSAVLTHVIHIETAEHYFEAFIDAKTGELVSVNDFIAQDSFNVVPYFSRDPTTGLKLVENPELKDASPNGWTVGGVTAGNNAITYKGNSTATANQTAPGVFNYVWDGISAPTVAANVAAAKVNAFYLVNVVHDVTYIYGFTEKAFNFQNDNFGKGGTANDRITISVQDASGMNNADFMTPQDGQGGRMRMFLWSRTNPQRDGALENDIVFHEATHGTSNRLTGGGTGRCLQTLEAGGMGEGWSDAFADWMHQNEAPIKDYVMGAYVIEKAVGIRSRPYSTDMKVNNLTYASITALGQDVHKIGEVWANVLHNIHAALVDKLGFSQTAKTNSSGTEGNIIFMRLFIDQLAIQPCAPTMLTARDAWIQADATRYKGQNSCTLWKVFASRGLGMKAANRTDDATVPAGC